MHERCCHAGGRAILLLPLLPLLPLLLLAATAQAAEGETAPGAAGSAVVIEWNELAYEVGYAEDELRTFKTQRAMAMMHLAMHDAVNAVLGRFAPFALEAREPGTDPTLAAAHAAHAVLADQYPAASGRLDAALRAHVERGATAEPAQRAAELGASAAAAVLAARQGDEWDRPGTYAFATGPGTYQTMAPWDGFVLQPGFRHARPFGLRRPDQFRPGPPPALDSAEFRSALDEVRRQGGRDSAERDAERTAYAVWWMEFAEGSVNRLARELVARRDPGLAEAARLFALLDMSLYDAYVATWDAKFEYDHWRPSTAIRAAEQSGDPPGGAAGWEPMRPPPPFPEYVSAHAAGCASAFEVMRRVLGEAGPFVMRTATAPPGMPERRFPDFSSAAAECADSRVRLGWHFRYATDAGLELGRAVAGWVMEHHLLPRHAPPGPKAPGRKERARSGSAVARRCMTGPTGRIESRLLAAVRRSSPVQPACHRPDSPRRGPGLS